MRAAPPIDPVVWPPPPGVYTEVVDVRSPGEFAADAVPGAVNLPVLSDAERAEVGTVYVQVNPFAARKLGAGYVSANVARHLHTHFADKPKDYRPLVYCWRGGQRSGSLSIVLSQIGWRVGVVAGGYKGYRAWVNGRLETLPGTFRYQLVAGATGSGKTRLLGELARLGEQVLDLEDLARHRGSLLGSVGPQPTQKRFESLVIDALTQLDPSRPVWVEAESRRIGDRYLPPTLWAAMQRSTGVELAVPHAGRVRLTLADYAEWTTHPERITALLPRLATRHGHEVLRQWQSHVESGDWAALVESLLTLHYDPSYAASTRRLFATEFTRVPLDDPLDPAGLHSAAVAAVASRTRSSTI